MPNPNCGHGFEDRCTTAYVKLAVAAVQQQLLLWPARPKWHATSTCLAITPYRSKYLFIDSIDPPNLPETFSEGIWAARAFSLVLS